MFKPTTEPPLTHFAVGLMTYSQTLDISDARTVLGYQPQLPLADGAARFAAWWKLQSQWAQI